MRLRFLLLGTALAFLAACASDKPNDNASERELYTTAHTQIENSNFTMGIRNLEALESRFPFGPYAEQGQLELLYAYYKNGDNENAIATADRFIRLHPQHAHVDYAYYMRGLARYTENQGFIERFLPFDATQRDPGPARESFADFALLLQQFPNSEYEPDARVRMIYLRNLLARYEVNVANYFFKRKAWLAAANRGRGVVENFPQAPAVPDALAVMVQAYMILGMDELADGALAVLRTNYPTYPYLDHEGRFIPQFSEEAGHKPWLERLTFGLFGRKEPPQFNTNPDDWLPRNAPLPAQAVPPAAASVAPPAPPANTAPPTTLPAPAAP